MPKVEFFIDHSDIEPTYQFDGRFVIDGQSSPLCGVKLWLPIDCYDDARIQIVASDANISADEAPVDIESGTPCLVSESLLESGLHIDAKNLHIRSVLTKYGLQINRTTIAIDHIASLIIEKKLSLARTELTDAIVGGIEVSFELSDLEYGQPHQMPIMDYLGNRELRISNVHNLSMHTPSKLVQFELQKHWSWRQAKFGRWVAGGFPALVIRGNHSFCWNDLEEIQQVGRDACLLLTLAARHLTVMQVMVTSTNQRVREEWFNPLRRQKSTTEENATGPLVDVRELDNYFDVASVSWSALTERQKDAVRLAVYAINPFVESSTEGDFVRMFSAVEGLAKAWFPSLHKIDRKIPALITKFPPRYVGSWSLVSADKDGLSDIRNLIAHGNGIRKDQMEALMVGTDQLQVWIEQILLSILGFIPKRPPTDWLTRHVEEQTSELPRLRTAIRSASTVQTV